MSYTLEQVAKGNIQVSIPDLREHHILWNDSDSNAGVYVPMADQRFLFAETCNYQPAPRRFLQDPDDNEECPFHTDADQLFIDLNNARLFRTQGEYDEGDVQGLVYAVDSIAHGGNLDPESYWELFIKRWIHEARSQKSAWIDLGQTAIENYTRLGLIEG